MLVNLIAKKNTEFSTYQAIRLYTEQDIFILFGHLFTFTIHLHLSVTYPLFYT